MSKKPETVPEVGPAVVDLEELILGPEEFARRKAVFPDGILRPGAKLSAAQKAQITAAKFVSSKELAAYFKVSITTIQNLRKKGVA